MMNAMPSEQNDQASFSLLVKRTRELKQLMRILVNRDKLIDRLREQVREHQRTIGYRNDEIRKLKRIIRRDTSVPVDLRTGDLPAQVS